MSTEFTVTVKASSGDYSTLSAAEAGLQNDITAATIKVFSISAASSPTIAAGDTVLGLTSAATGICVLVNAARTQILIKTIAVAAFQSGETVQKTTDATKTVTLSNAGDSPIVGIACYSGLNDTTAVSIDGWTTGASNYIRVYCPTGEGHSGYWDTSKYNLTITAAGGNALNCNEEYVRIEGLQIKGIATTNPNVVIHKALGASQDFRLVRCLVDLVSTTASGGGAAIYSDDSIAGKAVITAYDCIVSAIDTDFPNATTLIGFQTNFGNIIAYNCVAIACGTGFKSNVQTSATYRIKAINCVGYCKAINGSTVDFSGTMLTGTDYNASTDASATGAHSIVSQSAGNINFTSTTKTNSGFCALGAGSTLASAGTNDPGSGLYSTDIRGASFVSTWDIGANARAASAVLLTITTLTMSSMSGQAFKANLFAAITARAMASMVGQSVKANSLTTITRALFQFTAQAFTMSGTSTMAITVRAMSSMVGQVFKTNTISTITARAMSSMIGQALKANTISTVTAAAFSFVAKNITFVVSFVVFMTAATFKFSAKAFTATGVLAAAYNWIIRARRRGKRQ